jgi:hypothetical protein
MHGMKNIKYFKKFPRMYHLIKVKLEVYGRIRIIITNLLKSIQSNISECWVKSPRANYSCYKNYLKHT